jgi:hypothetical protein
MGDTIWELSNKYYGDPFRWGKIYNANINMVENPDRIYPDEEITIPELTDLLVPAPKPETVTEMNAPASEGGAAPQVKKVETAAGAVPADQPPPIQQNSQIAPSKPNVTENALQAKDKAVYLEAGELLEEMPEDQKGWAQKIRIAPNDWKADGVIAGKVRSDNDELPDSLAVEGELVRIKAAKAGVLKPGDKITAYMKGVAAVDEDGSKLGLEIQKTGTLEVVSVEGTAVRARIIEAVTSVEKGQLVRRD